jgi:hypothetical protein
MKSFLNIFGVLAFAGGILAFLAAASAVHQILGAIGVLTGCSALGLAKLIELFTVHLERTSEQRKREVAYWERPQTSDSFTLPPIPGTEKWHIAIGAEVQGPYRADEVRALSAKQVIGPDSFVLAEGWATWKRLRECEL